MDRDQTILAELGLPDVQDAACEIDIGVAVYRDGERSERGEVTLDEAAAALNVSPMTVLRMIRRGVLGTRQLCKGAPWVIRAADLSDDAVRAEANGRRRQPLTQKPNQQAFTFQ